MRVCGWEFVDGIGIDENVKVVRGVVWGRIVECGVCLEISRPLVFD